MTDQPDSDVGERVEVNWTCFHCGETFTDASCARLHFGRDEGSTPACIIKGADGGLLKALRDAEEAADNAIQMVQDECTDAAKAYHAQRCRHSRALIAAEESGYEKGLADGRATPLDPSGLDEQVERGISGETVAGFRVAAWREAHPEHGDKYGHRYSEHWSTPNTRDPRVKVERLFTEQQLLTALRSPPVPRELREALEPNPETAPFPDATTVASAKARFDRLASDWVRQLIQEGDSRD